MDKSKNNLIEEWYQWKELVEVEGKLQLLNVQREPEDFPSVSMGEFLFASPEEAKEALKTYESIVEAKQNNWILVKTTFEVYQWNDDPEIYKT